METPDDTIRQLLHRRELAAARHRAAVGRRLGLADTEMTAVAHLAQHGQLTPTELGTLLDLSSGGVSALVGRLEAAGHVDRVAHPSDGRSTVIRLAPALVEQAGRAFGPLVGDLDRLVDALDERERAVVGRFIEQVADVSEAHAELARDRRLTAEREPVALPVPSLWG